MVLYIYFFHKYKQKKGYILQILHNKEITLKIGEETKHNYT